jgi:hypothetical protein
MISPQLPLTCDEYDAIHDHLIPVHLLQGKKGAHLLLINALNNRRNAITAKKRKEKEVISKLFYLIHVQRY